MKELLKLKRYLGRHRWTIMWGLLALVLVDVLQLFIPNITGRVVDRLAAGGAALPWILGQGGLIVGIALAMGVGRFFWRYGIIGSSRRIERQLRADLFSHLLSLDTAYFDEHRTGDLMAHATNDIQAVQRSLGFGLVTLTDIVVLGTASIAILFHIAPRLAALVLIPLPLISVIATMFGMVIRRLFESVQGSYAGLTEQVRENISGIKVVKLFVQERAEQEKFAAGSRSYMEKNMRLVRFWSTFWPLIMFIASLSQGIAFLAGGRMVVFNGISIGQYVAFTAYLGMLVWPMMAVGEAINVFQRGSASQGRINRILEIRPGITDRPGAVGCGRVAGAVEFRGVTFYHGGKVIPALQDVSLDLPANAMLGVTGTIGSGKSTLVNLLLRLYEPQQGAILVDGKDVRDYTLDALRRQVAYVPQDGFLFSDTLRENIAFGQDGQADPAALERVAKLASVHEDISGFPQGYETVIGERGVTLSGGQKQRVALARALLLDKPILILDDSLSAVDADTERTILNNIRSVLDKRTAIVISHRIFAIQDADIIIVLDQGKIVEQGKHDELLAKKGKYYEMYVLQQLEQQIQKT